MQEDEQSVGLLLGRAAHLNATDMLHILTTALVPSFRQLVSRSADAEAAAAAAAQKPRGDSPETDAHGTSKSSSSLFSIPAGAIPERASDLPEQPQDASSVAEAKAAARIAATGVRPDNPCVDLDSHPAVDADAAAPAVATAQIDQPGGSKLAALTITNMKKARHSMTGAPCDEDTGSVGSCSPMSHTGSISTDALTDALRKLVLAGAQDGSEGVEEVIVPLRSVLLSICHKTTADG
jgi:hypothetical protein